MPLPLAHSVIGLTTQDVCSQKNSALSQWKVAVFVVILANLPDIDVLIGLLFRGNGSAFHRGPTHSLIFALLMGLLVSMAWKVLPQIPRLSFHNCFFIILSHVMADHFFTNSPVSFFWPVEVNWSTGYSGWADVINSAFLQSFNDSGIIIGCAGVIILNRFIRRYAYNRSLSLPQSLP